MFAAIMGLTDLAISLLGKIGTLRQIAKQKGELTTEEETALDKKMSDAFQQAHWQPSTPR